MESPRDDAPPEKPAPTERDLENARVREAIAARMAEEYGECLRWAMGKFGPGWVPSCRHMLVGKDEEEKARRTGARAKAAATVYTVKNETGDRRHFAVGADGRVTECAGYEEGFGSMLLEPDLTRTIEVRGEQVHPHRYSLCWAGYELYHPKNAQGLADLRATRERRKKEKLDAQFVEENPLFASIGMTRADFEKAVKPEG